MIKAALVIALLSASTMVQSSVIDEDTIRRCANAAKALDADELNIADVKRQLDNERSRIENQDAWLRAEKATLQSFGRPTRESVDSFNRRLWDHQQRISSWNSSAHSWNNAKNRYNRNVENFNAMCADKTAPQGVARRICSEVGSSSWCSSWR